MISIIIPTLNEEVLLPKLLEQLNASELRREFNYEIIVSDGGSKDKTIEIAQAKADKVISYSDPHDNIAFGRNRGSRDAAGDILIFMNADVRIEDPVPFFHKIDKYFRHSEYLAMTCVVKTFPEEACFKDTLFHGFCNIYFYSLNVFGVGMGRGECNIVKKDVFQAVSGYDVKLVAGEDWDLYKRIAKKGKIFFDWNLKIFESPRRYRKMGYMRVILSWFTNSFSIVVAKKSSSRIWEQVR
jgi:glycosyltransferase involved in cell wall biosynthesis